MMAMVRVDFEALRGLRERYDHLTPQQRAETAGIQLIRNPYLKKKYFVKNLTKVPQIVTAGGEEGSGNSLCFEPEEERVVALFLDVAEGISLMGSVFYLKEI